jgi:hypothetical protein
MMDKKIITKITITFLLWFGGIGCASDSTKVDKYPESEKIERAGEVKDEPVDAVLKQLNKKALELKFYQARIEYKFVQPLLESESLRKGTLNYAKYDTESKLRLSFQTRKIDDEEEEKYVEEYIVLDGSRLAHPGYEFEGMWAVLIDYEIESVKYIQLAEPKEPNKPVDVFDLASKNFPMVGFTRVEDLKKQFEVSLIEQKKDEAEDFIQVHLKVKPNSVYKDDYVSIDFWIDKELGLPAKVVAVSTEPATESLEERDMSEIKFLASNVNKRIDKEVFDFKIPQGFGEPEIIPLQKNGKNN